MEAEQRTERAVYISVAGVHLIDDQHLAAEAEEPNRLVPGGEDGEECLIDRPDTDVSQERLLPAISQPVRALPGAGFLAWTGTSFDSVLFLDREGHAACAVCKDERSVGAFGEKPSTHFTHPRVHRVGRGHGGSPR